MKKIGHFVVEGNPLPKQSFRYSKVRHHQPQALLDWQEAVGWAGKRAISLPQSMDGRFYVIITFYRGNKRRVDLDNLSKAVLDALEGIYWRDDTQVVSLYLRKRYDKSNPRAEIRIWHNQPSNE